MEGPEEDIKQGVGLIQGSTHEAAMLFCFCFCFFGWFRGGGGFVNIFI